MLLVNEATGKPGRAGSRIRLRTPTHSTCRPPECSQDNSVTPSPATGIFDRFLSAACQQGLFGNAETARILLVYSEVPMAVGVLAFKQISLMQFGRGPVFNGASLSELPYDPASASS